MFAPVTNIRAACRTSAVFSTSGPTMMPGVSHRNTSGMSNASQSCMNRAAMVSLTVRSAPKKTARRFRLAASRNRRAVFFGADRTVNETIAARFMQLCDAFDIPLVFLCDTPGIMVGPEVEKTALVRHAARMFVTGANISVPFFTIILRKGYGLGAQAMAGGSFKAPFFTVAWPTGEFGGMGLEGAVKLGYRNELAAIEEPG